MAYALLRLNGDLLDIQSFIDDTAAYYAPSATRSCGQSHVPGRASCPQGVISRYSEISVKGISYDLPAADSESESFKTSRVNAIFVVNL